MTEEKREFEERGRRERLQRRKRRETDSIYVGEVKDGKPWTVTFTDVDDSKTEWKDGYEIDDELDG